MQTTIFLSSGTLYSIRLGCQHKIKQMVGICSDVDHVTKLANLKDEMTNNLSCIGCGTKCMYRFKHSNPTSQISLSQLSSLSLTLRNSESLVMISSLILELSLSSWCVAVWYCSASEVTARYWSSRSDLSCSYDDT